jgi:hypothetical protein
MKTAFTQGVDFFNPLPRSVSIPISASNHPKEPLASTI